jgi:penicillin G amidase
MATTSVAPSKPGRRIVIRVLLGTLFLISVGLLVAGGWFYRAATASLPLLDGELRVAGLNAPVTVVRDTYGVPHIKAESLENLFFAQGYITAQDRLWQMDINRRYGRGELSEIFGKRTLLLDKSHRILQLRQAAERAVAALSERDRKFLDAYVRGVNALIAAQKNKLPIEFRVLGYTPRPWTAEDSVIIGVNIAESLSSEFAVEHTREAISDKLGPELAADLYVSGSWRDRFPGISLDAVSTPPDSSPNGLDSEDENTALLQSAMSNLCDSCFPGSNNWVVSGAHTTTGKPLLSNDMHLQHSIPNVWYEVHLHAGDFNVVGVSFPGLPFVVGGHNQSVAWGFTNLGPDVQDLFIETFNAEGRYQTPDGWADAQRSSETINVKGEADVTVEVVTTRHGPIVTELLPGETRKLALQWTIYDPQALQLPFYAMNSAQNWADFTAALSRFGGATQNVVYADIQGNIAYHAAGWIPIRKSGTGATPISGADGSHDWIGYIPFDQLPGSFNPSNGIIGTANARVVPDTYPHFLANQWGSPYRTERIYRVLENGKKFSAQDMLALQMDTYSEFDRTMANAFVYAVDHSRNASDRARRAADLMRGWNGYVEIDAVAPTIATCARRKLWKLLLEPKLGGDWERYQWFSSSIAMERLVQSKPQRWLPPGFADWNSLLTKAAEDAVADPGAPRDLAAWQWGKNSPIVLQHPLFGDVPFLNRFSGPGTWPQSGSGSLTVKAAGRSFGASERATYDSSDWDASTLNIVTGESGQIFSQNYNTHWNAWYKGLPVKLPFTDPAITASAQHRLVLKP